MWLGGAMRLAALSGGKVGGGKVEGEEEEKVNREVYGKRAERVRRRRKRSHQLEQVFHCEELEEWVALDKAYKARSSPFFIFCSFPPSCQSLAPHSHTSHSIPYQPFTPRQPLWPRSKPQANFPQTAEPVNVIFPPTNPANTTATSAWPRP